MRACACEYGVHACMYATYIYVCIYVCMYVYVCDMYACMYMYIYMYIYTYIHAYVYTCFGVHPEKHTMSIHGCQSSCSTHMNLCIHTHIHTTHKACSHT
jgi:hypothetical protein